MVFLKMKFQLVLLKVALAFLLCPNSLLAMQDQMLARDTGITASKVLQIQELCNVDSMVAYSYVVAIEAFTTEWYSEIRAFQNGNAEFVYNRNHDANTIKRYAGDIESLIACSPKWTGGDTYRGIAVNRQVYDAFLESFKNGTVQKMYGSASWTTDLKIALHYANANLQKNGDENAKVMRVIFVKRGSQRFGTSIQHLSKAKEQEYEILVSEKARYVIKSYKEYKDENLLYLYVDEI